MTICFAFIALIYYEFYYLSVFLSSEIVLYYVCTEKLLEL